MKAKTIEELRNKFFMDCTNMNDGNPKVDIAPHNLFEWIKENIIQPEPQKGAEEIKFTDVFNKKDSNKVKEYILKNKTKKHGTQIERKR